MVTGDPNVQLRLRAAGGLLGSVYLVLLTRIWLFSVYRATGGSESWQTSWFGFLALLEIHTYSSYSMGQDGLNARHLAWVFFHFTG